MSLVDNLKWRYATKRMNGNAVPAEDLAYILEATRLSASSYGLQPYTILVVSNQEIKTKLQAAAYGQPQLVESSHVLVFCVPAKLSATEVNNFIQLVADERKIPVESLKGYQETVQRTVDHLSEADAQHWSAKQAYIALSNTLSAAAERKVDACPMEGFIRHEFDQILGLQEKGLHSVAVVALGYRSAEDGMAAAPKVRKSTDVLYEFIK